MTWARWTCRAGSGGWRPGFPVRTGDCSLRRARRGVPDCLVPGVAHVVIDVAGPPDLWPESADHCGMSGSLELHLWGKVTVQLQLLKYDQ